MQKIIITKGLPASGKTHFAKRLQEAGNKENAVKWKRVNKDDLRSMLDNGKWSKNNEQFVLWVRDFIIEKCLEHGYNIVVDDTNFNPAHENRIMELVKRSGKEVEITIEDFTGTPLETCLMRNAKRANGVPESVIREMWTKYVDTSKLLKQSPELPPAVICDIDGTLARMNGRSPYDYSKVDTDSVIEGTAEILQSLSGKKFLLSGRKEECRKITEKWLKDNGIEYDELHMRESGNNEEDSQLKKRLYETHIKDKYYVTHVFDDRLRVCRMWHNEGLPLFRVGNPDAEF